MYEEIEVTVAQMRNLRGKEIIILSCVRETRKIIVYDRWLMSIMIVFFNGFYCHLRTRYCRWEM